MHLEFMTAAIYLSETNSSHPKRKTSLRTSNHPFLRSMSSSGRIVVDDFEYQTII